MRERFESHAHLIHFSFNRASRRSRQRIKRFGKVCDQICSAAATIYFGSRVVYCPAAISRRDWSSLAFTSSVNSS